MYNPQGFEKYGAHIIPPAAIFHLVRPGLKNRLNVEPDDFRNFLVRMGEVGLHAISLRTYWMALLRKETHKIVNSYLLTFDDGYDCFNRYALPIMQELRVECTLFIPTDYIGQWNTWNPKITFNAKHMSWDEIHVAADAGIEIGSHGCSHRSFQKLKLPEIEHELGHSKQVLEEKVGQVVKSFAYPYGDAFSQSNYIVSKFYDMAVYVEEGGRVWPEDQFRIKRYDYLDLINMVISYDTDQ